MEFNIDKRQQWLDLSTSYLYFHASLKNTQAWNVATRNAARNAHAGSCAAMVNNAAFSMFSHVEIKINGRQVTTPAPKSFAFIQWFQAFFHLSDDDKKTWGELQGYYPVDTVDVANPPNPTSLGGRVFTDNYDAGDGTKTTYAGDKPMILPLNQIPCFSTHKFFPPQVNINIKFYPFANNWPVITTLALAGKVTATIGATQPYLVLKQPMINPTHALRLEKHLANPTASKARYVLDNIVMRDYTLPDGVTTHHFTDVVPPGPMPKRIVMMLQPQNYYEKPDTQEGVVLDPFTFEKNNLSKVETDGDGGWDEIDLVKEPLESYRRFIKMFEGTGRGVRLSKTEFETKYNMYIFDFTPGDDYTDPVLYKLPRGTQRFKLTFNPATANHTKVLFLMYYSSVLQLDMLGSVLFEDTVSA